jgi:rRNA maturation protein Nop10
MTDIKKEYKCSKCGEVTMRELVGGGVIIKPSPHKCDPSKQLLHQQELIEQKDAEIEQLNNIIESQDNVRMRNIQLAKELESQLEENKQLRETLGWYCLESNYNQNEDDLNPEILYDRGARARFKFFKLGEQKGAAHEESSAANT